MSFGVGIGDAVLIVGGILKFAKLIQDAPEDLQGAVMDLNTMEVTLKFLKEKIGDEKSFLSSKPDIAKTIERDMPPLVNDMQEISAMLHDFREKRSITVMGRIRYAVVDNTRVKGLRFNFTRYRERFASLAMLVMTDSQDYLRGQLEDIQRRQDEEVKTRRANASVQRDTLALCEKIFLMVNEMPVAATRTAPERPEQILKQLEEELVDKGTPRKAAQEKIESLRKLLREASTYSEAAVSNETKSSSLRVPDTSKGLHRRKSDGDTTRKPGSQTVETPEKRPVSSSSGKIHKTSEPEANLPSSKSIGEKSTTPVAASEDTRILFVDDSIGMFSLIAQVYLEMWRLHVANHSGRWLFKRAASAGFAIESTFAKVEQKALKRTFKPDSALPVNECTDVLQSGNSYPWSEGYPNELKRLRERTLFTNSKRTGLHDKDFETYSLIVCFSTKTEQSLKRLRFFASIDHPEATFGRILLFQNCSKLMDNVGYDDVKVKSFVEAIKADVKLFISERLGDTNPEPTLTAKKFRTLQIFLDDSQLDKLTGGLPIELSSIPKIKEIEQKTDCKIKLTKYRDPRSFLVSIIGAESRHGDSNSLKDRLLKAEALVKSTYHK